MARPANPLRQPGSPCWKDPVPNICLAPAGHADDHQVSVDVRPLNRHVEARHHDRGGLCTNRWHNCWSGRIALRSAM